MIYVIIFGIKSLSKAYDSVIIHVRDFSGFFLILFCFGKTPEIW